MTRRERLMATLEGKPVDRPAVSFYEIGGWAMEPSEDDFIVWNDPSWRPLVQMALEETDLIRMVSARWTGGHDNGLGELTTHESRREVNARFTRMEIRAPGRTLTSVTRRDRDTQTTWTVSSTVMTRAVPMRRPVLVTTTTLQATTTTLQATTTMTPVTMTPVTMMTLRARASP